MSNKTGSAAWCRGPISPTDGRGSRASPLRPRRHRRGIAAAAIFMLVGSPGGAPAASQVPEDITRGVWAAEAGSDIFLFDLRGSDLDSLTGAVHVMRDGRMESQLAITQARYGARDLEIYIASTGATYRGRVDIERGRIEGTLEFPGQQGPAMELQWLDPEGLPGFAALPRAGEYVYREPAQRNDRWTTAKPEEVGLTRSGLEAAVRAVARDEAGLMHSIQIVKDGRLVLDEYFHGYGPEDLHRLASATKSVCSLLVGLAIDRGLIRDVNARLLDLLEMPGSGPGWEQETLRDLLTMSMGLDWQPGERESVHGTGPDFFRLVLDRRVVSEPGTTWDYVSANVNLLAGVVFNTTGMHADTFADGALFQPLGIQAFNWDYGKNGGYNLMDGSLQLRPRDLAKIGAMVAAEGRWNGRQVVSTAWIRESTRTHFRTGQPLEGYGYLWWTHELSTGADDQSVVLASGMGSQFVIIFPQLDLVVVTTGGNEDNGRHMAIAEVLTRTLLPTVARPAANLSG